MIRAGTDPHRPHVPLRPVWLCQVCLVDWPCLAARTLLPIEYVADPVGLAVHLGTALQAAAEDLTALNPNPGPDPAALHARFLSWVRPRTAVLRTGSPASGNASAAGPTGRG